MLKLFWTPAKGGGVPAEIKWQAQADSLMADAVGGTPLQSFVRGDATLPAPGPKLAARLDAWVKQRSHAAPVTILAHGYQYNPATGAAGRNDNPFGLIYGIPGPHVPAQLSLLPLVGECDEQGGSPADVAIAFAWLSEGTLADYGGACWNNDYQLAALDLAPLAARALATVIAHLGASHVPVRILAHSLGTRLVGQAIGQLRAQGVPTSIERVILLGGAEFCVDAAAAFTRCDFDVINIASRKDGVLRLGGEQGCHPVRPNGSAQACVIGRNGLGGNQHWLDLQLDSDAVVRWFRDGHAPSGTSYAIEAAAQDNVHPEGNLSHWAYYTNHGNRVLVRDLVQHPAMSGARLRAANVPDGVDSVMFGTFNGLPIPDTPITCAARRGETLMAAGALTGSG